MSVEQIWYDAVIILHRTLGLILKPFGALAHMLDTVFLEIRSKFPRVQAKHMKQKIYTQQHTYMTLILWVTNK